MAYGALKAVLSVAVVTLVGAGSAPARAEGGVPEAGKPVRGLFMTTKTALYEISSGGDFSGTTPYWDAAAAAYDFLEGVCVTYGGTGLFVTVHKPIPGSPDYEGIVLRNGQPWATGFGVLGGLGCSEARVYVAEVKTGKVWDVTSGGDFTGKTPLVSGLDTPFDVLPQTPSSSLQALLVPGHDAITGVFGKKPYTVETYTGIGLFLAGLTLYTTRTEDGGQRPWLAVSSEASKTLSYMTGTGRPKDGPWTPLATLPMIPSSLLGIGSSIYVSGFEANDVYVVDGTGRASPSRFAYGFPTVDLGEFAYAHHCGDGIVDFGVEDCDDAGESASCNADCAWTRCGDGLVNAAAGELCDTGTESLAEECLVPCLAAPDGDDGLSPSNGCSTAQGAGAGTGHLVSLLSGLAALCLGWRRRRAAPRTTPAAWEA